MGISMWQLLIVLLIIVLLFGTKKLKNIGGDLGSAVKGFKKAMGDGDSEEKNEPKLEQKQPQNGEVIEGTAQCTETSSSSKQS